jgi:hypothetical protein
MIKEYLYPKKTRIQIITEEEKPDYDSCLTAFRSIYLIISFRKLLINENRKATDIFLYCWYVYIHEKRDAYSHTSRDFLGELKRYCHNSKNFQSENHRIQMPMDKIHFKYFLTRTSFQTFQDSIVTYYRDMKNTKDTLTLRLFARTDLQIRSLVSLFDWPETEIFQSRC